MLQARPWLLPWGTESWPARTPWVLGFSPVGGNRSYSEGEPVNVLSRKGKEDCRNSWRCLRSTWKRTTCWTLAWIPSNPLLGSAAFPRATFARGANGPQNGRLHCGGVPEINLVRSPQMSHPPLPRGWIAGAKRSSGPTVERVAGRESKEERAKEKKKKERKKNKKTREKIYNNLFQIAVLE